MPIVNEFVKGIEQPPYRDKFGRAGGLRQDDDFSEILLHFKNNGCQLLVHENALSGSVVLEIHQGIVDTAEYERLKSIEVDFVAKAKREAQKRKAMEQLAQLGVSADEYRAALFGSASKD